MFYALGRASHACKAITPKSHHSSCTCTGEVCTWAAMIFMATVSSFAAEPDRIGSGTLEVGNPSGVTAANSGCSRGGLGASRDDRVVDEPDARRPRRLASDVEAVRALLTPVAIPRARRLVGRRRVQAGLAPAERSAVHRVAPLALDEVVSERDVAEQDGPLEELREPAQLEGPDLGVTKRVVLDDAVRALEAAEVAVRVGEHLQRTEARNEARYEGVI